MPHAASGERSNVAESPCRGHQCFEYHGNPACPTAHAPCRLTNATCPTPQAAFHASHATGDKSQAACDTTDVTSHILHFHSACYTPYVTCRLSHVTCHMPHATCHMPHVAGSVSQTPWHVRRDAQGPRAARDCGAWHAARNMQKCRMPPPGSGRILGNPTAVASNALNATAMAHTPRRMPHADWPMPDAQRRKRHSTPHMPRMTSRKPHATRQISRLTYPVSISHVTCHMSHAASRMSHATCHMPHATCHMRHATRRGFGVTDPVAC
jgi:hypothetical protein